MQFFRYKEDRIPVLIITSLFVCDVIVFFAVQRPILVFTYAFFGLWCKLFIAAWNHHHQHLPTFRQTILNRLLEIVYTFHTGITTNTWVLHHNLGHHLNYLDQEKDESGWQRKDGTQMGPIEYTITIAVTGYLRGYRVGKRYPKFQRSFLGMGVFNLLLLCGFFWINWLNALLVFFIPMFIVYVGTCWTTYYHHAGLDTDDHMHASHNVTNHAYNVITGNLGYHTAHHLKQALHWSKLPELHREIEADIPPHLISTEFPGIGGYIQRPLGALWTRLRAGNPA